MGRADADSMSGAWQFDPVVLGRSECDAWAAYYRREWVAFLRSAVSMVRTGFGMSRWRSLVGAWYVLRANQAWAPFPDNDHAAAVEYMRRFYALVARSGHPYLDPARAATLEVTWWRVHRQHQRAKDVTTQELVDSLNAVYSFVYDALPDHTEKAARLRVEAMDLSDAWVQAGCDRADPQLAAERRALVASHSALRQATERRGSRTSGTLGQ
jgi:hypothetical protein